MAMAPNKMMTIVILGAIVLAGIGAVGLVYFAPNGGSSPAPIDTTVTDSATQADQAMTSTKTFSTGVLQRSDYSALDLGLISQGRLPVQAPAGTGKADPFQ